ncbi:LysR family transcriptional regulator [Manganibacter manganicus]|uniref:LysR family transcriptional regulator n=1 Tax=Manganibacter manganicus TaxID=1873176 RepID=A0A1V8RUN2_9HYPH|nr:LysR family transcriptional regulator [Pseudaminobacter manganicus]OQM76729.1 LysR family transcriptional regulator [Pseudaminobacter manganicus]
MALPPAPYEFRHLRYFLAAVEHGSFRKAAAALDVQESAISRRIRDLEDNIGASLFHRHSAGVRLTIAGEKFLPRAREIVRHIGESGADVGAVGRGEDGRIRIGNHASLSSGFLCELLCSFRVSHPGVATELVDGAPAGLVAEIRQLRLDVAFLPGAREWQDCDTVRLWTEGGFVVLSESHPLAARDELDWEDLAEETFVISEAPPGPNIRDCLIKRLARLGHTPDIRCHQVDRHNLLSLVGMAEGLTLTSEASTAARFPGICYRPIRGEVLPFTAVWSPVNDNPAMRRLLSLARTMSAKRQQSS